MKRRWCLYSLASDGIASMSGCGRAVSRPHGKRKILAVDVGLKTRAGFSIFLKKGTEIPAVFQDDFSTAEDNQTGVTLTLFSQESADGKSIELGEFRIEGIQPAPSGIPHIRVTIKVIETGVVVLMSRNRDTDKVKELRLGPVPIQEDRDSP